MHLNLSKCNLNSEVIVAVYQAVSRSKSLQAVHLCDNPGLAFYDAIVQCK
jgi:hypothetical protein